MLWKAEKCIFTLETILRAPPTEYHMYPNFEDHRCNTNTLLGLLLLNAKKQKENAFKILQTKMCCKFTQLLR